MSRHTDQLLDRTNSEFDNPRQDVAKTNRKEGAMAEDMGSTVPRRQLGRTLRDLRTEAGITLDAAAEALECSRQKVWRIESGLGSVRGVDVRAMCELYGARGDLTRALMAVAAETKAKGWWHAYGDAIPDWFELYVGLESAACQNPKVRRSTDPRLAADPRLRTRRLPAPIRGHGRGARAPGPSATPAAVTAHPSPAGSAPDGRRHLGRRVAADRRRSADNGRATASPTRCWWPRQRAPPRPAAVSRAAPRRRSRHLRHAGVSATATGLRQNHR